MNAMAYPRWLVSALLGAALLLFYLMEQRWHSMGFWLFLGFSLTLGMGHGALDTVLLFGQFKPLARALAIGLLYLALTLLSGWLLSLSFSWALIALLLMSVWHFGEVYGQFTLLRLAVGGASLMAPALLQGPALHELLQGVAAQHLNWLFGAWTGLAWVWVVLVCSVAFASLAKEPVSTVLGLSSKRSNLRALREIGIVFCVNFILSPLLQFALYFGLYHCLAHIARVRRATRAHQELPTNKLAWVWGGVMVLTSLLMAVLWHWLPSAGAWANRLDAQILHWLVVALGAVTVPHLLLVSYSGRWLGR